MSGEVDRAGSSEPVTLKPLYAAQAADAIDQLRLGSDADLYGAVCDAINLVCDHGDTAAARREQLRTTSGSPVWKVALRTRHADWVLLWWPVGSDAQIYYIGRL